MWTLKTLVKTANQGPQSCINEKWVPARSLNWKHRSLRQRIREAWAVFKGRAEAFTWPEGQ